MSGGGTEVVFKDVVREEAVGQRLLDGVSLTVESGGHVALVGEHGCGKTCLLLMAAGLAAPDRGEVLIDGRSMAGFDYAAKRDHHVRTGYVFEMKGLLANTTIFENIALPLRYHRAAEMDEDEVRARVEGLMRDLAIEKSAHSIPGRVDASAQKRALLARALVLEPSLLLIDEPQQAQVSEQQELVNAVIESRRRSRGMTVIQTDHDGVFGPLMPERVVVLEQGRIVKSGGPEITMGPSVER